MKFVWNFLNEFVEGADMGIFDFLNATKYKDEISTLEDKVNNLLTEFEDVDKMTAIELKNDIMEKQTKIEELEQRAKILDEEINDKNTELEILKSQLISVADEIEMESFSLYKPRYNFVSSQEYKNKLDNIRAIQKSMIKDKTAVSFFDNWTVDGSKTKGRKMMNDNIKQILRSFNNECEAAIHKVKFSNVTTIQKRIVRAFDQLNSLNKTNRLEITEPYLNLKLDEMYLAYEFEKKKEEEKELLREQRQKEREEKQLQEEIKRKKKIIDKDIDHYKNMIDELSNKLKALTDEAERKDLEKQIFELSNSIQAKEEEKEEMDYRAANATAGYVYIISNLGAFGENVVKIGVTRRLDPYERIAELSSASVPFRFDIHALIFSYEAYDLEAKLHKRFEDRRVNAINLRKEFFNISINDVKEALEEHKNLTIEFIDIPEAEEYRQTRKLRGDLA